MGAFGRDLQRHFGGTKYDVSTWKTSIKLEKTQEEIIEENIEHDQNLLKQIIGSCENLKLKYESMINQLTTSIERNKIEEMFNTEEYENKFKEWRDKFIKI